MIDDERLMGWKGSAHVSLLTLQGREVVAMICSEYQAGYMPRLKGQCDLVYRDGRFYLLATIDLPEDLPIEPRHCMGVDLGIIQLRGRLCMSSASSETVTFLQRSGDGV